MEEQYNVRDSLKIVWSIGIKEEEVSNGTISTDFSKLFSYAN